MFTRAWRADALQVEDEGRIISGIAVPYNSPTQIYEGGRLFNEVWKPGATKETIAKRGDRMRVLGFHESRSWPLGKPTQLADRKEGMWFEARISDTQDGNDALTLVRDGVLDGVSVGFSVPEGGDNWKSGPDGMVRTIARADVHEFSLVNFPAFDDARITSIREATPPPFGDMLTLDEIREIEEEVSEDEVRAQLDAQRLRLQVLRTRALAR